MKETLFMSLLETRPSLVGARQERRRAIRFPIKRELQYKILSHGSGTTAGVGETMNMSSSGILFTTLTDLPSGASVEVSVSWPVQFLDKHPLEFIARGRILRYGNGQAALSIQQHEFLSAK